MTERIDYIDSVPRIGNRQNFLWCHKSCLCSITQHLAINVPWHVRWGKKGWKGWKQQMKLWFFGVEWVKGIAFRALVPFIQVYWEKFNFHTIRCMSYIVYIDAWLGSWKILCLLCWAMCCSIWFDILHCIKLALVDNGNSFRNVKK